MELSYEQYSELMDELVAEGYDVLEASEMIFSGQLDEAGMDMFSAIKRAQSTPSPIFNRPRPKAQAGLSVGPGGFNVNGRPVQTGMSPIFQRPGAAARPAAAPAARPAGTTPTAPARPAAAPAARPSAAPTSGSVAKVTPTSAPASAKPATPARTFNPLMQRTFGYQTGNAPDQIAKASAGKPIPSGTAFGSAADPKVRAALNLPAKPSLTAPTTTKSTETKKNQQKINAGMEIKGNELQEQLRGDNYGGNARPDTLLDAYRSIYDQ